MKNLFVMLLVIVSLNTLSQDTIIKANGDTILSIVSVISDDQIEYYKFSNKKGPLYKVSNETISQIIFENGDREIFNDRVVLDFNSNKNPHLLLEKGHNVFVISADATSKKGEEYFLQDLNSWGYWNIVDKIENAHFVIVFHIDKKGMGVFKTWATFKTRDDMEFKKSDSFKKSISAFNGYNVANPLSEKLVEKYFKQEFK